MPHRGVGGTVRLVLFRPSVAAAAIAVLVACSGAPPPSPSAIHDDAVTVTSFNFPESVVLAEVYAQAMEGAGIRVVRQLDLGPREVVDPALERGLVEFLPEYAGTALTFLSGGSDAAGPGRTHAELVAAFAARGIAVLDAAPAQDANGFAVTEATASRLDLASMSDLAPYAASMAFGGAPECPQRPLCLEGLRSVYKLDFKTFVPLDAGGPLTVAALRSGQIDVGLLFTSDGTIGHEGIVLLRDDLGLQPAENVTPAILEETLRRFAPRLPDVVNAISAQLTTAELRTMNADLASGRSPDEVARKWLAAHGSGGSG